MFAQRRNLAAMHEAGSLFRAWGTALGRKLEQVLAKRRTILPSIEEEGGKPTAEGEEEMEEDFLDEGQFKVAEVRDDHGWQWILMHVYTYVVGDENEVQGPIVQSSIKLIFG